MTSWMTYKGLELPDGLTTAPGNRMTENLRLLADGAGSGLPAQADSFVVVQRGADDTDSAANLRVAYAAAKLLTPGGNALSATNRAVVFIPPGRYDLGTGDDDNHGLVLDEEFVDLIGISSNREDTVITSQIATASRGTIEQTASDVKIGNVTLDIGSPTPVESAAYFPDSGLSLTTVSNVAFTTSGNGYSMRRVITYSGKFRDCVSGPRGFGDDGIASGEFTNCIAGDYSFGTNIPGRATGTFIQCRGGIGSFGSIGGHASGTFIGCTAGASSFGSSGGEARGTFHDCVGGANSFGSSSKIVDGMFVNCVGGAESFGGSTYGLFQGKCIGCRLGVDPSIGVASWSGTFVGLMDSCIWKVTNANQTALRVGAGARVYNSTLIATGTGKSIDASSAVNAVIAHCRLNKGIGTNVTNLIATPYNVDDADIS